MLTDESRHLDFQSLEQMTYLNTAAEGNAQCWRLRVALHADNTLDDVDRLLSGLHEALSHA